MREKKKIQLPKGKFEGNCTDCIYANWRKKDNYGRVYCEHYGNYNHANDRNGCFNYKK